ncbi:hypothetical protein A2115_01570 [Candidatus Woesebacteria bacterium GWA1_41_8]|uniref:Cache domain-containing protein n=1 Tax=Candidatus Woesebacteria bacterium GWA1_41_8 TaxID=1802471 RepID=A0A1F7WHA9_9BACT|nr:MAG: hypothetical protein A2115_01570 [Candidatus Woesebacteria bacterium GWA1_41_8]
MAIGSIQRGTKLRPTPFFSDKFNRVWIAFVAVSVTAIGLVYFWAGEKAEVSLAEQILHREQVIARAGARSIENFIKFTGSRLTVFATRSSVTSFDQEILPEALEELVDSWAGTPVVEAVVIDKEGIVRFIKNRKDTGAKEGVVVSDRDYFRWAQAASSGEYFVGMPLLPRLGGYEGKSLVPVATPIFDAQEEFGGVLVSGILLDDLVSFYINPLRISDDTQVFLLNPKGVFYSAPNPKLVGVNIFEYFGKMEFPGKDEFFWQLRLRFEKKGEGKFDVVLPDPSYKKLTRYLMAYAPVSVDDESWALIVSTPIEDALLYFGPFGLTYITSMVIVIFIVIAFSVLLVLVRRYTQRDSFLQGFAAYRDHRDKQNLDNS